ncbi:zinc finger, CCHC-type containing protein, partial [Tanacetum coccineum]
RDAIFDENRFSSIPRPKDVIPNSVESQRDDHSDGVSSEITEPRKEEDSRTYNEAMKSRDAAFWKEAIDDEIGSIMENNTWVLYNLPPGCKPLGFRQKEGIDYFDTYALVARITTIRLLLALAAIHNLVIHQMDVKTTFLNGDLDEEVYEATGRICYVRFSMKDIGEADVIVGIKIKRENKGIVITQSHYIEKILKKFNREDCSYVNTLMDPVEKLKPNTWKPIDQLEYSRAIDCLMYAMTSTRPDIAYVVGRLSRCTSNPSRQHWKAIKRVFKYLRCTKDYGLSYVGYTSVLEGYSDASWINHVEDSSSTSGWVFLLGGEPIAQISIPCDSAPMMARAYSQIYNGKSRHLGVRHSMVRELIRNGVISIEFVRTQHNLADHLTKGLARDLLEIGTQVLSSRGARSKGTTYVNMKFSRFKKLGLSFLYVHQWIGTHGL